MACTRFEVLWPATYEMTWCYVPEDRWLCCHQRNATFHRGQELIKQNALPVCNVDWVWTQFGEQIDSWVIHLQTATVDVGFRHVVNEITELFWDFIATKYRPLNIALTGCPETSIQRCEKSQKSAGMKWLWSLQLTLSVGLRWGGPTVLCSWPVTGILHII